MISLVSVLCLQAESLGDNASGHQDVEWASKHGGRQEDEKGRNSVMHHLWGRWRSLYFWPVRTGLRISFVQTTDDHRPPGQEVSVESGCFTFWGFIFGSELNGTLKLMWVLELKLPVLIYKSLCIYLCKKTCLAQCLGTTWKLWWILLWVDEMDELLMFGMTVELGLFITSVFILMEVLGFVDWLELQYCWMEKNNESWSGFSVHLSPEELSASLSRDTDGINRWMLLCWPWGLLQQLVLFLRLQSW